MNLAIISDRELLTRTQKLVAEERELLTEVLNHLREIQRRRLYSDLGFSSLFSYCTGALKYSESQAQRRIVAMRIIVEIPEIREIISNGDLTLTNISQANSFFAAEKTSPQEKLEVLECLKNKSSREGKKILLAKSTLPVKAVTEKFRQVTAEITEVKFGADEKLLAKMKRIKGLMAHKKPGINTADLIDELCEIALDKLDPSRQPARKSAKRGVPKLIPPAPQVRKYLAVNIKREIWQKAEGKCENCKSEFGLEIDHKLPISLGGNSAKENLRLLCRACNQRAAITKLGRPTMQKYLT